MNVQINQISGSSTTSNQISTNLTMIQVLGFLILWTILSLTIIGLFFWPYAFAKLILNSMVIEGRKVECDLNLSEQIGHIFQWIVICICTLSFSYPFYVFGVMRTAINRSRLV